MLTKVTMPSAGTNTDQLLVVAWLKNVGDVVKRGDILMEVETDKAVLEVESFAQGTLLAKKIEEGSYGTVGDVIAYIGNPGDMKELDSAPQQTESAAAEVDDFTPIVSPSAAQKDSHPLVHTGSKLPVKGGVKATPAAKRSAKDLGMNLDDVHQRVGKEILRRADVIQLAGEPGRPSTALSTPAAAVGNVMACDLIPLSPMRRIIAERMQVASTIPAFTAEVEVDMSACIRLRSDFNQFAEGTKLSYHDIVAKAVAIAASDYPLVNASFTDTGIKVFRAVNIGLAVSLEQGLVVPVVCDVRAKNIAALARENASNIAQVRTGKFDPRLLENGTFTISNLGKYPISRFTAILNPPQSSILAVGSIQNRPVWSTGQWREQATASLTGTFDHRVVDGSYGAEFLTRLKELLEHPHILLL
jgi:pyruvate dehydrogenase E2 component (dihydrolipoamide acetyltransferase)